MDQTTPISKEPIEIGRTRRPMEAELTPAERQSRSDQVHSELEIREQLLAEQETHEQEAKAKKEAGKEVEARIAQLDLRVKALSSAVRMGRETRQVDVLFVYDPTRGEVLEKRSDTDAEVLARKPTSAEWDTIKAKMQAPIEATGDPCRAPREIPGLDPELLDEIAEELEEGAALTIQVLGYRVGLRQEGAFDAGALLDTIIGSMSPGLPTHPELTKAERWAFAAGVKQAAAELAKVEDDGTPFGAPGAPGQVASLRAPRYVPGIDLTEVLDLGDPDTWRELGETLARGSYLPGDTAERMVPAALEDLRAPGEDLQLTEDERAEFSSGIAEGIAAAKQVLENIEGARAQREASAPKKRGRKKSS